MLSIPGMEKSDCDLDKTLQKNLLSSRVRAPEIFPKIVTLKEPLLVELFNTCEKNIGFVIHFSGSKLLPRVLRVKQMEFRPYRETIPKRVNLFLPRSLFIELG